METKLFTKDRFYNILLKTSFLLIISSNSIAATFVANNTGNWSARSTWVTTKTGTITVALSATAVVGVGTAFTTELQVGDKIYKAGTNIFTLIGTVSSITDNTHLTLTSGATAALSAAVLYSHGIPTSTDNVQIGYYNATVDVTLTVDGNYTCNQIYFCQNNPALYKVDITASNSLTVTNYIYLVAFNNVGDRATMNVSGTLTAGAILLDGGTNGAQSKIAELTIQSGGIANITGDININTNASSNDVVSSVGTGVLNLGGNFLATAVGALQTNIPYTTPPTLTPSTTIQGGGTISFASTSVLNLNGSNVLQVLPVTATTTYGNLYFNNTGSNVATFNAAISAANVLGNIVVQSGTFTNQGASSSTTLNAASTNYAIVGNAGKTFEVDNGATFQIAGTYSFPTGFGTITLQPTSTVNYIGTTQTIAPQNFGNLTISAGASAGRAVTLSSTGSIGIYTTFSPSSTNNVYTITSSTVVYNGNQNQTMPSNFATYVNLTINNTGTSGNSYVTLSCPVTVSNILTLTDGILVSSATNLLTLTNSSTSATSRGNSSGPSFVKGPIRWNGLNGAGPFIFPTGDGTTKWAKVAVSGVTSATDFTAQYTNSSYGNVSSSYLSTTVTPSLTTVSSVEYWDVARTSGTGSAAVTLYWEDASASGINSCGNNGDLKVAHYNTVTNKWENANSSGTVTVTGGCTTTLSAGTVKSDVMSSFSPFTFGSGSSGVNPLPIELLSFDAVFNGTTTDISWQTASEINNNYFTVERSTDGINFTTPLGTVTSKALNGNSTSALSYGLNDANTTPGIYYYRLKQTDFDFKHTYSNVVAVTVEKNIDFSFELAPNPTDGNSITGFISSPYSGMVTVKIYNIAGNRLHSEDIQVKEGEQNPFKIQFKDRLDAGTYIVITILNGDLTTKKLMTVSR